MADDIHQLHALEIKRCEAIATGDVQTLQGLLSEDYVHVHMTARVDNRAGHLAAVAARPRRPVRGELTIRVFENVGIIIGDLDNHMDDQGDRIVRAFGHGVAVKRDGVWQFVSMQLTPRQ